MAYINVVEWTTDQVTDWMKGLDDSMYNYVYSFTNNEVGGRQLLNIRPYELEQLGMYSIGHQEIVLEAVENLRNFHYNIDKENLQFMALHIATAASSLHRQLATQCMASKIETHILNDITRTIGTIKPLIGWLERAPFQGQNQFTELCSNMLRLGLEMAMIGQRDGWVQNPVEHISETAKKLERLANYIIQDITDPMLLQPASLNLVTLKKRESELGFNIEPSYHGIHRVTDIKYHSPAHNSGKVEDGDEIVQINYQTVVGWQYKSVLQQLRESLPDVLLTLKKRPKHTKIYGQIYMQPYRLPSKKRAIGARWGENLPSPRAGFLTVPDTAAFNIPISRKVEEKTAVSDTDSICSEVLTPTDTKPMEKESRLYYPKPRAMLQRRHSICGDEMSLGRAGIGSLPLSDVLHEHKMGAIGDPSSPSLRDKSVSFGFGLEIAPRPTTCIGIATTTGKFGSNVKDLFGENKKLRQVPEASPLDLQSDTMETEQSKPGVSKVVPFDANMKVEDYHQVDEKYTCNVQNTLLETFEPIPFADEEEEDALDALRNTSEKAEDILEALDKVSSCSGGGLPHVEAVNIPVINRRGRLDKSHSTPAYDNSGGESDTPPPIEPRKECLLQTPPVPPPRPPPRPRKQKHLASDEVPPPPPKPQGLMTTTTTTTLKPTDSHGSFLESREVADSQNTNIIQAVPPMAVVSLVAAEINELHTPTKSRTLTLTKKHRLIAKRRNINLKLLGTGEIQGHLYRRTKDRRGVTFWARLYFVMLDTLLYGFRSKEAPRASSVIFLPGFTVSLAKEVHSKPFAFKVYHSAKTFYFAAESLDALNQWVEFIRQAANQLHPLSNSQSTNWSDSLAVVNTKDLFSETESSGEESESVVKKNLCTPSPQGGSAKDMASALSPTTSKSASTPTTSAKHDRRYLGSLRKLTKGSLPSFKSEKKPSSDIPVPTDQYRSYRKVPGGSFGIQIGTNTPGYHDTALHPYNSNTTTNRSSVCVGSSASFAEHDTMQRKLSVSSNRSSTLYNNCESNSLCLGPAPPPSPAPTINAPLSITCGSPFNNPSKSIRKIPYNFIHASNPNLVEFDFQTAKTLDYSLPKINPSNSWDAHQNIQGPVTLMDLMLQKQEEESQEMYNNRVLLGVEKKDAHQRIQSFVTLKDLMLQKQEEEAQEMYDNRVLLGVEKKADERKRIVQRRAEADNYNIHQQQQTGCDGKLSKTQSRSLPKTPDYEISFKPDDENIKRTRTKEGLKLRDFGYELISGDEPLGGGDAMTTLRQNSNTSTGGSSAEHQGDHSWTLKSRPFLNPQQFLHKQKKQHSSTSCSSTSSADFAEKRTGSFKKKSSERIFQFNKHASGSSSAGQQHVTMTLPLNKKSSHSSERTDIVSSGIKKSHTYNNDLKEKAGVKYEAHRKNSAPMPIFSKLSFTSAGSSSSNANSGGNNSKTSKEKKLLGSPLLHRTIFGSQHHGGHSGNSIPTTPPITCTGRDYDREIFSQVILPKISNNHHHRQPSDSCSRFLNLSSSNASIAPPDVVAPPPPTATSTQPLEGVAIKNSNSGSSAATPEYPNMECPPVFEPEIYSLSDPNASLNLLLRRSNNNCNAGADEKQ